MLTVLRRRDVALLWLAGLVSNLGDWFLFLALPYFVYTLTGSALATGGALAAGTLPRIVVGPLAGVLVDRWDRRRTLLAADLLRALLLLPLFAVDAPADVWLVYAVQFAQQALGQFFVPAKGALLPRLVPRGELAAANALDEITLGIGRLLGPPLGGALLVAAGFPAVVLADAASFLTSAALLTLIAVPRTGPGAAGAASTTGLPGGTVGTVWREWAAGLRLVWGHRGLVALFGLNGVLMLGYGVVFVLLVVFVRDVRGGGPLELAWFATAQGAGTLLAGLALSSGSRAWAPGRVYAAGAAAAGLGLLAAFHAPALAPALAALVLAGVGVAGTAVGGRTLLQAGAADAYRGRVLATAGTWSALLMLTGQVAGGALAPGLGVVATLDLAAALYLATAAGAWLLLAGDAPAPADPAPDSPGAGT